MTVAIQNLWHGHGKAYHKLHLPIQSDEGVVYPKNSARTFCNRHVLYENAYSDQQHGGKTLCEYRFDNNNA